MIEREPEGDWRALQSRVAAILRECGCEAEIERVLDLARGKAEIDVYARDPTTTPPSTYLVECKLWRSPVPQAEVQAFRSIVADAGAHQGLFVSSRGFQAGAFEVVRYTNVSLLDWDAFQRVFADRWASRYWVPTAKVDLDRLAGAADPSISDAAVVLEHGGRPLSAKEACGLLAIRLHGYGPWTADRIWALRDEMGEALPEAVRDAADLRSLLSELRLVAASN